MALKVAPLLVTALTATSILMTACEKGVLLRDPNKGADFKVQTQIPGAKTGVMGETNVTLMKAELATPVAKTASKPAIEKASGSHESTASTEASESVDSPLWQSSITIQIKTPAHQTENIYTIKVQAQAEKFSFGKVEARPGDPMITWKAICQEKDCSTLYIAAMLHFHDDQGAFRELQILMVGVYRNKNEVKRYLFPYDEKLNRFSELVKALESLELEKTRVVILDPFAPATESKQGESSMGAGHETPATGTAGEATSAHSQAGVASHAEAAGQASATGAAGMGTGTQAGTGVVASSGAATQVQVGNSTTEAGATEVGDTQATEVSESGTSGLGTDTL